MRTARITLTALLKWAGVVATGGEAKTLIQSRRILVNGQVELRRGRKIVPGDLVAVIGGPALAVVRSDDAPPATTLASELS
ncbi:MAG: RNA-binding S4 domain-containing protein [Armatimonadetes bacterium]|nr:RNA-binding S4 domain-containing protein [Armatimonadota bacterium]